MFIKMHVILLNVHFYEHLSLGFSAQPIAVMFIIMYTIWYSVHFYGHSDMPKTSSNKGLPLPVKRSLRKLGQDIRDARRRRRIPVALMAERASISRTTLNKVEKGDPGVAMGIYATVLFVLGMVDRLGTLADVGTDTVGLEFEEENLPKRIHRPKKRPPSKQEADQ